MEVPPLSLEKIAELQTLIELVVDAGKNDYLPGSERVAETYRRHFSRLLGAQEIEPPLSEESRIFKEASQREDRETR